MYLKNRSVWIVKQLCAKGICEHLVKANFTLIGLETKNKLKMRSFRHKKAQKVDLTVSDDEEFNKAGLI